MIVLIFDTLRSDYLSCYGGDVATPSFESAADRGTLFESAFGTAPGTPISHASLYSGQYPSEHGVTGQYISLPDDVPVM
ncbi:MAG: sulfatase-like hydrolase/transferase, partial [Halobacteriales archaeon]|nr:sulfatase-like hydrolase/transferase [Halobacteriales archaeon]